MKKGLILFTIVVLCLLAFQLKPVKKAVDVVATVIETPSLINKDSITIKSRVNIPEDYKRVNYPKGSFEDYLRNYKLSPLEVESSITIIQNTIDKVVILVF